MSSDQLTANEKIKVAVSLLLLVILGSFQAIIIPIIADVYTSPYFVLVVNGSEFCIFFMLLALVVCKGRIPFPHTEDLKSVISCGVYSAFMSIGLYYASSPERTPVVFQSILQSLVILPSFIFSKLLLNKPMLYIKKYITLSVILLFASVVITAIPLTSKWSWMAFLWVMIFLVGKTCRGASNVYQEKYLREVRNELSPLQNKVLLGFWSRVIQLGVTGAMFWIEYVIGYSDHPWKDFSHSINMFLSAKTQFWFLQSFIFSFIILYGVSIYLNSISTNYNMITAVATNPATAIFFTVFPKFNTGIVIPIEYVIPGLVCSVLSVIFWILGERKISYVELFDDDRHSSRLVDTPSGSINSSRASTVDRESLENEYMGSAYSSRSSTINNALLDS